MGVLQASKPMHDIRHPRSLSKRMALCSDAPAEACRADFRLVQRRRRHLQRHLPLGLACMLLLCEPCDNGNGAVPRVEEVESIGAASSRAM